MKTCILAAGLVCAASSWGQSKFSWQDACFKVAAAKYLPARDTSVPKQTKPVIYGLDEGPKVVNQ
jgi:hypothetical protein